MAEPTETTSTRGLLVGLLLGLPILAFGIRGVLIDADRTHPAELARWIIGAAVLHDVVLVPVVLAVGVALRRVVPARAWPSVRWVLTTAAVLAAIAWPSLRGYGRASSNPSLLPRDYALGLVESIVAVALAALAYAAVRHRSGRTRPGDAAVRG